MTIRDYCTTTGNARPDEFEIIGTDISDTALGVARSGRYGLMAGERGLRAAEQNRWFRRDGNGWALSPEVLGMVKFRKLNLQSDLANLGRFDVVFLRYVAIYFNLEFKKNLTRRIARILQPGGAFLIGATESLRGVSDAFTTVSAEGGTFHRLD